MQYKCLWVRSWTDHVCLFLRRLAIDETAAVSQTPSATWQNGCLDKLACLGQTPCSEQGVWDHPLGHISSLPKGLGNKTGHCGPMNYMKKNQLVLLLSPINFGYKSRNRILKEQETFVSEINAIFIFSMRSYERQFKKKSFENILHEYALGLD